MLRRWSGGTTTLLEGEVKMPTKPKQAKTIPNSFEVEVRSTQYLSLNVQTLVEKFIEAMKNGEEYLCITEVLPDLEEVDFADADIMIDW
jgi:hypothetical protein